MIKTSAILRLLVLVLAAACGPHGPASLPTAAPSMGTPGGNLEALAANAWQWERFTDPVQRFSVGDPEDYVIAFLPDGTVEVKADCNEASRTYTAQEDGTLSIEIGPMTLAACAPESRSEEFLQSLGFAAIYFFQDGHLFIDMMADGGTLEFGPSTVSPTAADGTSPALGQQVCKTDLVSPILERIRK